MKIHSEIMFLSQRTDVQVPRPFSFFECSRDHSDLSDVADVPFYAAFFHALLSNGHPRVVFVSFAAQRISLFVSICHVASVWYSVIVFADFSDPFLPRPDHCLISRGFCTFVDPFLFCHRFFWLHFSMTVWPSNCWWMLLVRCFVVSCLFFRLLDELSSDRMGPKTWNPIETTKGTYLLWWTSIHLVGNVYVYILCVQIYLYMHLIMYAIYRFASLNTIYSISIFKWFIQCLHATPEFCFSIFQQLFCYMIFQLESVIIVIPGSLFLTFMEPLSHPIGYPSVMTLK